MAEEKKCKHCSMMIPVDAKICPHCRKTQGVTFAMGCLTVVVVIFLIGFISSLIMPKHSKDVTPQNTSQTVSQPTQQQEVPSTNKKLEPKFNPPENSVSATNLYEVYKANEVAADEKLKGKRLVVYGKINAIEKNIADQPSISFEAGTLSYVNCRFPKDKIDQLTSLQRGQMIAVEGMCNGMMLTTVFLHDCELRF